jgi:hypothetical protein
VRLDPSEQPSLVEILCPFVGGLRKSWRQRQDQEAREKNDRHCNLFHRERTRDRTDTTLPHCFLFLPSDYSRSEHRKRWTPTT